MKEVLAEIEITLAQFFSVIIKSYKKIYKSLLNDNKEYTKLKATGKFIKSNISDINSIKQT